MINNVLKLLLCFITIQTSLFAQLRKVFTDAISQSNYPLSVSFQPFYLLNNTIKFDAELQQKEKASAFVGGLEIINGHTNLLYYYKNNKTANNDYVSGLGISLAYKLKLNATDKLTSFYFSPGVTLRNLNITVKGEDFYSYQQDGIEYFTYGEVANKYPINSALVFGNVGYHKVWTTNIIIDSYLGFGYKISTKNQLLENSRNYEQPIFGFNYNGFGLQFGVKLGYQIK